MPQHKITQLTPEQEALIPFYREKWSAIALSAEPIDRQKAEEIIKAAYVMLGEEQPKILFFDSPYAAIKFILNQRQNQVEDSKENQTCSRESLLDWKLHNLHDALVNQVYAQIDTHKLYINGQLDEQLRSYWEIAWWEGVDSQINNQIWRQLNDQSREKLRGQLGRRLYTFFRPGLDIVNSVCQLDFFISVLNPIFSREDWEASQSLLKFSNWIYPFENICIVCGRPIKLFFDNENSLHAEGEPAIQFADGYSLYSYHGVTLPEKYGKLHPNQWRSQWLLEEDNAELRRVLTQGIGYSRICEELQAIELDSWQEYILLKIDADVDEEPIHLLKMTCPSTGFIHVLRVPPDMHSAREAICWVNWETDPEEFLIQT